MQSCLALLKQMSASYHMSSSQSGLMTFLTTTLACVCVQGKTWNGRSSLKLPTLTKPRSLYNDVMIDMSPSFRAPQASSCQVCSAGSVPDRFCERALEVLDL